MTQAFKKCTSCHTVMPASATECEHCKFADQKSWASIFLICTLGILLLLIGFIVIKNF